MQVKYNTGTFCHSIYFLQAIEALKEKIDQTFGVTSVRHTLTKDESEAEL
ncbi:hypothetical protein [Enterococcus faecium]|nr:hypothetical protein [Enterococcus faecium]